MRQRIYSIFCSLFLFCSLLEGKSLIKETNDFSHVFTYLEEGTLFVFDLDNTLIETAQHLGSDQWVSHQLDLLMKQGLTFDDALNQVIAQLVEVQNRSEVRLVDPIIPDLLSQMQNNRVPMVGLTKRDPQLSDRTLEQLSSLQIDFGKNALIEEVLVFEGLQETTFKQGIIFAGHGIEKGPALIAYLNRLKIAPKKIVVIDDKMNHIQNIAKALEQLEMDFIGIRYGGADEKVKSFNPKIAELQWEHFQKILSDEQALHLMQLEDHSTIGG
jgi:FMN phosphatase YigB (HAD superfamily)